MVIGPRSARVGLELQMASAATDVAETRAQVSQAAARLGSAQGNTNHGDETSSRSVGTNPRGSHVGPHHTGHPVTTMADRSDIEIVLKDLDDPNVCESLRAMPVCESCG